MEVFIVIERDRYDSSYKDVRGVFSSWEKADHARNNFYVKGGEYEIEIRFLDDSTYWISYIETDEEFLSRLYSLQDQRIEKRRKNEAIERALLEKLKSKYEGN